MAELFCKKPKNYNENFVVRHIDKNRFNNYYKNLEWTEHADTVIQACGKAVEQIDLSTKEVLNVFRVRNTRSAK